jgi:hypothetical protein
MATDALRPGALDPVAVLDRLDSGTILTRLAELDREHRALRVLLRAARARERRQSAGDRQREVAHA